MPGGNSTNDHWRKLKKQLQEVFTHDDPDSEGIQVNSFWNHFRNFHGSLPNCQQFNLRQRRELLESPYSGCEIFKQSRVEYVRLQAVRSKTQKKAPKPLTENKPVKKKESPDAPVIDAPSKNQAGSLSQLLTQITYKSGNKENPLAAPLNIPDSGDFPALGAEEEMHPRRGFRPSRHEPYADGRNSPWGNHSQERYNPNVHHNVHQTVYHNASMQQPMHQPVVVAPLMMAPVQRPNPHEQRSRSNGLESRSNRVPSEQLERVAEDCIERLSESKVFVSVQHIERLLLEHFKVNQLSQLGVRKIEQIKKINEHQRMQCKVNLYIEGFVRVRSIVTLYELAESLREYVTNKEPFEQLHLGPLLKQPLVYDNFKMPEGSEILEITTADVLQFLRDYLSEKDLWTNQGLDTEEFIEYIMQKKGVSDPYALGLRVRSMPLAISILKKAQRDCGQTLRSTLAQLKENVEKDLTRAYQMFCVSILDKEPGLCQVKKQYMMMKPDALVEDVMQKLVVLCETIVNLGDLCEISKRDTRDLRQTIAVSKQFTQRLRTSSTARQLFQIAVISGRDELHAQLTSVLAQLHVAPRDGTAGDGGRGSVNKAKPATVEVVRTLLELFDRCLFQGSLTLMHLARIEDKLLEKYEFSHFSEMTSHTFLTFLLNDDRIKKYLEECGGSSLGLSSSTTSSSHDASGYQPNFPDVLDFLRQCRSSSQIEGILCHHYGVKEVSSLGHGSLSHLNKAVEKHKQREIRTFYEGALTGKNSCVMFDIRRRVGALGTRTKDQALACLQNCPLLEDLADWSQWSLLYEPELGSLKEFIQKYGGFHQTHVTVDNEKVLLTTNILALETQPGKLVKLTGDTSPDKFARAVQSGDAHLTTGHLVSLVVSNKGVDHAPLALLANHIKTALLQMQAKASDTPGGPGTSTGQAKVVEFVLECLSHLPLVTCQALANQVFLEPLSYVIGQANSKDLLLRQATSLPQQNLLYSLGILLGIGEWTREYEKRCVVQREHVVKPEKIDLGHGEIIELGSSSESEDEDDDEDDRSDMDYLSDEECDIVTDLPSKDKVTEMSDDEVQEVDVHKDDGDAAVEAEVKQTEDTSKPSSPAPDDDATDLTRSKENEGHNEVSEGHAWQLIEEIRREEFGIDMCLNEDGQRLMEKHEQRQGRSLKRLSHDLYSKDSHFVLELIQNADDNEYPKHMLNVNSEVKPTVQFTITPECVTISNNEVGFIEKNIRAICDVGCSTKGKHKAGYIGQKGIGFKSVFRVTNRPEIHSNDFHFCFDVDSGPMGYILPHWINEPQLEVKDMSSWSTNIVLPLKQEMSGQTQSLAARFHDIHPSLLLFLHRLRRISIIMDNPSAQGGQCLREMVRHDIGEHIVEIKHSDDNQQWIVVKKTLDAKHISLQAKSGADVESTEIAMAFPVQSQQQLAAKVLPGKQPVFAFLPLRSYGFRFIIQGDFDVPSSREDVDKDSVWNQWLCSELHAPFIQALEVFKRHAGFGPVEAVCRFLQFVPVEDEILGFFHPVARSILQHLCVEPCLPTQPSKDRGVAWKLPSQLVLANDHLVREVVTSQLLWQHLNLDFLHEDVAAILNENLAHSLGIQSLTSQHLLELGKAITSTVQSSDEAELSRLAKWLACLYRSLDELNPDTDVLSDLKLLPIMPLADGSFAAVSEKVVFFPLDQKKGRQNRGVLRMLESSLSSLHPGLLSSVPQIISSQVERLLSHLGIKRHTPHDIVHHHILPALKSPNVLEVNRELIIAYIIYIKEQLDVQPKLLHLDDLKPLVVVNTNQGLQKLTDATVHFTTAYGNPIDLAKMLPGYNWMLLDACYIQTRTATEKHQWRDFFSRLGVLDFLSVKTKTLTFTSAELDESLWSGYKQKLVASESYSIEDHKSEELDTLINNNHKRSVLRPQMVNLYRILAEHWSDLYSQHSLTQIRDKEGRVTEVDTTFSMTLKNSPWIPTAMFSEEEDDDNKLKLVKTEDLRCGRDLFLKNEDVVSLLSHHVPYLDDSINQNSQFAQFLGVHFCMSVDFVRGELKRWCTRQDEDSPREFITSMSHIYSVYKYLSENLPPNDLRLLFKEHPVVFYPLPPPGGEVKQRDDTAPVRGIFHKSDEVRWHDHTHLFRQYKSSMSVLDRTSSYRQEIGFIYHGPQYRNMFVMCGGVQETPSVSDYITLLTHITTTNSQQRVLKDVLLILHYLAHFMTRTGLAAEDRAQAVFTLKKAARENKLLPTKGHEFVSLDDKPLIADDKEKEKLFRQGKDKYHDRVFFIETGEKLGETNRKERDTADRAKGDQEAMVKFLQLLDIPSLTSCIEVTVSTESYRPSPDLQTYVSYAVPYIQQLLYNNHPDVYTQLIYEEITSKLETMQFATVGKLEAVYYLQERTERSPVVQTQSCHMTGDGLSVLHDRVTDYRTINRTLANFFSKSDINCSNALKNLLSELLTYSENSEVPPDIFFEEQGLLPIPEEETIWRVPPPQIFIPPPPSYPPVDADQHKDTAMVVDGPDTVGGDNEEEGKGGGALKAWPPQSNTVGLAVGGRTSGATSQWPPPAPPQHYEREALPANLKPSRLSTADDAAKTGPSGSKQVSGEGVSRQVSNEDVPRHVSSEGASRQASRLMSSEGVSRQVSSDSSSRAGVMRQASDSSAHYSESRSSATRQTSQTESPDEQPLADELNKNGTDQIESEGGASVVTAPPNGQGISPGEMVVHVERERDEALVIELTGPRRSDGLNHPRKRPRLGDEPPTHVHRKLTLSGHPAWIEQATELEYEEIGSGEGLPVPTEYSLDRDADHREVAMWGELLVKQYLEQLMEDPSSPVVGVKWSSESDNPLAPYDFHIQVKVQTGDACYEVKDIFIEVKTTSSDSKAFCEISLNEINFAQEKQERFHLYRVFNAGNPDKVRLSKLENIADQLLNKRIKLCLVV